MLVLGLELIGEDLAVVADDAAGDGAVVVFVLEDAAPAAVEPLVADQAVVVLVLEAFAAYDAPARGSFGLESGGGGTHGLTLRYRSAGRQSGRPERGRDVCQKGRGGRAKAGLCWQMCGGDGQPGPGATAPWANGYVRGARAETGRALRHSRTTGLSSPTAGALARE